MNVSEAIDILTEAELKQLAVKSDKNAVIGFINLGILELHKRFELLEDYAEVTIADAVTTYTLDGSDPNVSIDLSDKQLVLVSRITDMDNVSLFDTTLPKSEKVKLPSYNKLILKDLTAGDVLDVTFRAAPKFLVHEKEEIPLPPQFFEALFNYVGYRGHSSVKGDIKSENNTHYQRFEKSCGNIEGHDLGVYENLESDKFSERGFF